MKKLIFIIFFLLCAGLAGSFMYGCSSTWKTVGDVLDILVPTDTLHEGIVQEVEYGSTLKIVTLHLEDGTSWTSSNTTHIFFPGDKVKIILNNDQVEFERL